MKYRIREGDTAEIDAGETTTARLTGGGRDEDVQATGGKYRLTLPVSPGHLNAAAGRHLTGTRYSLKMAGMPAVIVEVLPDPTGGAMG